MMPPFGLIALTICDVVKSLRKTFETFFDCRTEKKYELYDDCRRTECVFEKPLFFGFSADGRGKQRTNSDTAFKTGTQKTR